MIFGDLTRSDTDARPNEIRLTDMLHVLAPPAAMIGGLLALVLYLAVFAVLQVLQMRRESYSARVLGDTLADVTITAVSAGAAAGAAIAVFGVWPWFIWQGWAAAAAALTTFVIIQRART